MDGGSPACSFMSSHSSYVNKTAGFESLCFLIWIWKRVGIIFRNVVMRCSDVVCGLNISSLQMWFDLFGLVVLILIDFCWFKVLGVTTFRFAVLSSDLSAFGFKLSPGHTQEMEFCGGRCGRHALSLLVG